MDTLDGVDLDAHTPKGIVYAQTALFVCAENESAAELLVVVAHGDFCTWSLCLYIHVGHTPSLEVGFESLQRMFQIFESCTSVYMLARKVEVKVSVGQDVVACVLRSDLVVVFRHKNVALYASVQSHLVVFGLCEGKSRSHEC